MESSEAKVRLDKWLWAARFFKTRAQATEAINGGHVHLNGARVKPSRAVQVGDRLEIRRAREEFEVTVTGLAERRGSASEAARLYEESEASRHQRQERAEQQRLLATLEAAPPRRPDKKGRRQIIRFTGKGG
ncbi:MAG TPA: S4 domain-containing protein [Gammaproteobacteria bacterium]